MRFEEVLPAFRAGKKIKRESRIISIAMEGEHFYIVIPINGGRVYYSPDYKGISVEDLLADDWEVVE